MMRIVVVLLLAGLFSAWLWWENRSHDDAEAPIEEVSAADGQSMPMTEAPQALEPAIKADTLVSLPDTMQAESDGFYRIPGTRIAIFPRSR